MPKISIVVTIYKYYDYVCSMNLLRVTIIAIKMVTSAETNLFFERIRISNLIRNPEIFRIRIRILFVVRKFSNPNPNIRDSEEKIRIRIRT